MAPPCILVVHSLTMLFQTADGGDVVHQSAGPLPSCCFAQISQHHCPLPGNLPIFFHQCHPLGSQRPELLLQSKYKALGSGTNIVKGVMGGGMLHLYKLADCPQLMVFQLRIEAAKNIQSIVDRRRSPLLYSRPGIMRTQYGKVKIDIMPHQYRPGGKFIERPEHFDGFASFFGEKLVGEAVGIHRLAD